jgi:hypothetical protein
MEYVRLLGDLSEGTSSAGQGCNPVKSFQLACAGAMGTAVSANRGNMAPQVSQAGIMLGLINPHSGHRMPVGLSLDGEFMSF